MASAAAHSGVPPYRPSAQGSTSPHATGAVQGAGRSISGARQAPSLPTMSASPAIFDAEMRDSQARGRGLHEDSDDYGADNLSISGGARHHYQRRARSSGSESFQVLQKRRVAAQILDLPEVLMIQSLQHGESIPATRLRYTRMLCNMEAPMPVLQQPPQPPQQQGRKKSSSARASLGGSGSGSGSGGGDGGACASSSTGRKESALASR